MTTVGYGDKAPKSIAARLFAIAWILVGIVTFSILTGSLTTALLEASSPDTPNMVGAKIGTMRNRIYDAHLVVQHGGNLQANKYEYRSDKWVAFELMHKLVTQQIDGIFMGRYTYWRTRGRFNLYLQNETKLTEKEENFIKMNKSVELQEKDYLKKMLRFFLNDTTHTDIPHSGEKVFYGILVQNREHYEFFKDAIINNRMAFRMAMAMLLYANNTVKTETYSDVHYLFLDKGGVLIIGVLIGIILFFGFVFETIRKSKRLTI